MYKNNFNNLNDKIKSVFIDGVEYKNNNFDTCNKMLDFGENTKEVIKKMEDNMLCCLLLYFDMYYIDNNNNKCSMETLTKYYYRYTYVTKCYEYDYTTNKLLKVYCRKDNYINNTEIKKILGRTNYKMANRYRIRKVYIIDKLDRKIIKEYK